MKKAFTGYIQFVYKLDKKNTVLFLILNFLTSLFIGVETIIIAKLIDNIKCNYEDLRVVFINVGCLFAAWGVKRIIEYRTAQRGAVLRKTMNERIPNRMVEVKSKIPYATLEKTEIQELIYRVEENGEEQFAEYFYNTIFLIVCVMEMGWLLSVIAVKEIWIALLMLLIVVPYVFFAVKNGKLGYEAYEKSEEAFRRAEYYQSVICNRANVEERTVFSYGNYFNERWRRKYKDAMQFERRANWKIFSRMELSNIGSTIAIGIMFWGIICMTMNNSITIGFMISVMKSIINYIDKVSVELAKRVSTYEKGASYLKDVQSFFALNQKEKVFGRSVEPTIQWVEFRDVSFAYPGSKQKVLNHFSLKLEDGKQYAIVGENGAGKSTLIKLLMGVYDSYEGEILINGVDIRSYDEQSLRDLFSYVPQDVTRYEISLDEYLKVRDREKIEQIFDEYGIDFMPDSKDKIMLGRLEEGAIDLSGGQWQLLAIVRACVNEKNINILDEPTAAIDPIREAELYYTFQKVLQKRFAILITHRLGAAKMANEIIAIKDGRVAERGSHEELMSRKGMYAQMYALQKKWYE